MHTNNDSLYPLLRGKGLKDTHKINPTNKFGQGSYCYRTAENGFFENVALISVFSTNRTINSIKDKK
jgi:hypothetical protein